MRRLIRWALLVLAAVLVILGVYHGLSPREPLVQADAAGSAAMGLVLLDEANAVYVLAVTDQSAAYRAGVMPGDYILSAGGVPVQDAATLDALIDGQREALELLIRRSSGELRLTLECR